MRPPRAAPTAPPPPRPQTRPPRAFSGPVATETPDAYEAEAAAGIEAEVAPAPARPARFWSRLFWASGALLVSLGLGLLAERLIADLFARYEALGWIGLALLALFVLALAALVLREVLGLLQLRALDGLRARAARAIESDSLPEARAVAAALLALYGPRSDLAQARAHIEADAGNVLDGAELVRAAETGLMGPLDARARVLVAASARRVALVTAVSPRALIDIAFVVFESTRLARNLADLYGARPGALGFWRLLRAILTHLAVTGGLVLTDGVIEQLVGQGLATRLSARLGEGVVNGLMTVRVGIAAMRVVRPLPFSALKSPTVADFAGELVRLDPDSGTKK